MTSTLAQGSQAFTALAFLAGSLELVPAPLADIAGVVMWAQVASVAYIVCNQLGDILKVLALTLTLTPTLTLTLTLTLTPTLTLARHPQGARAALTLT